MIQNDYRAFLSLQGTLKEHSKPTQQSNFVKEPFLLFRTNAILRDRINLKEKQIENINSHCLTANIRELGNSDLRKLITFNKTVVG